MEDNRFQGGEGSRPGAGRRSGGQVEVLFLRLKEREYK